ncbi:MAG: AAA family ATPase [Pseudoramibacter sp.]
MSIPVLIIGQSGTGKSTSMRNFSPDEIELINVEGKQLPFRSKLKPLNTDSYREICKAMKATKKKTVVIDDAGYLITNSFMRGHSAGGGGNSVFLLYNQLADNFWKLIGFSKALEPDKIVYFMMHEDKKDDGTVKPKTIGKLLDEKVCLEGMFTIVLRSAFEDGKYIFHTNTDGFDVCKTPIGMFETPNIDNDLKMVDGKIREYYNLYSKESRGTK